MQDVTTFEAGFETSDRQQVQRIDVIPGSDGRRRWSPEAKARIVTESFEAGANIADIARRNGILPQQLYSWRRELRDRGEQMAFVPAMVEEKDAPLPTLAPASCRPVEIVIEAGGMTIRVPEGASADHIERVLLAVQVTA